MLKTWFNHTQYLFGVSEISILREYVNQCPSHLAFLLKRLLSSTAFCSSGEFSNGLTLGCLLLDRLLRLNGVMGTGVVAPCPKKLESLSAKPAGCSVEQMSLMTVSRRSLVFGYFCLRAMMLLYAVLRSRIRFLRL